MASVTVASVRRTAGILVGEISDADVTAIIAECEPQIERHFNTTFTPKTIIEQREGNETSRMILYRNPVLSVRDLYIDGDQEDTANLIVSKESGKIELSVDATSTTFKKGTKRNVIKYVYGWLEESSTSSTTSAAEVAGTSVSIALASITGFSDGDWVEIYGMDGYREAAQINATPSAGAIVVDKLVYTHESGSTVVKLQVSPIIEKLMNVTCALAMVARIVGQSYTDIVGYNLGEMRVQKGEPYTQWRETAAQLIDERDRILAEVRPRPCVM